MFGADAAIAEWLSQRLGQRMVPPYVCIGMTDDERTYCGGALFNNWNGFNIDISVAMDRPITRSALRAIHNYVFIQIKATRLTANTKRSNRRARKLLPRLGFEFEGVARRFYGPNKSDDAFCFALFPESNKLYD